MAYDSGMEPNYNPYWEWNHPYLEVEDIRPVDEQGDAEVWGIPEASTQYIFQFIKEFFGSYGEFSKAQNAPSRDPGDCFSMPIRSDWRRYAGESPKVCFWVYTIKDLTLTGMVTGQKMGTDTSVRTGRVLIKG
jgi:hypothetical protein